MVIILSIEESDNQIISGFPEFIILTTNVPSTIFYTLDGTEPDENSDIFVERIVMPTTGLTTTLKAVAISGLISSSVLEETYFTDSLDLNRTRLVGREGINILPPNKAVVDHLSYDEDGNEAQRTSIEFQDLELVASTTNSRGERISGDTTIDFINFNINQLPQQAKSVSYLNSIDFNPKAAYIIMDGSNPEELSLQSVRVINRPAGSMVLHSKIFNQNQQNYNLVTGNFVRYMINPRTGKMTFYYRESRENRWLKSTQQASGDPLYISFNSKGPPQNFVFRWVEYRTQSRLF